jgi:histidine triad (HIT) family protein
MAQSDSLPCVFCAIARGEIPAHIICEDGDLIACLDIGPIRPGHTQIITRQHFPYFDDLPPRIASAIVVLGQRIAKTHRRLFGVDRAAFVFTGGDIAHVHAHVVPMVEFTDITSRRYIAEDVVTFRAMPLASAEELAAIASAMKALLAPSGQDDKR